MTATNPGDWRTKSAPIQRTERRGSFIVAFAWIINSDRKGPPWIDFAIFRDTGSSSSFEIHYIDKTPLTYGFIKWDGCMKFWSEGPIHTDTDSELSDYLYALQRVRSLSYEIMP